MKSMPKKIHLFRDLLKEARISRGLSQQQMARKLGLASGQAISNWERGCGAKVSHKHIRKISHHFDLHIESVVESFLAEERENLLGKIRAPVRKGRAR